MTVNRAIAQVPQQSEQQGWSGALVARLLLLLLAQELGYLVFAYPSSALPQIAADLRTDQVAWLQTVLALVAAVGAVLIGKLADRYGKKKVLLSVLGIVGAGLLISGLAPNFWLVLLGRAMQGTILTTPFLIPALIRDVFPRRTIPLAVALSSGGTGIVSIGASLAVGGVIGGFGWRATFLLPAVVTAVVIALGLIFLPESKIRAKARRLDLLGAALLGLGVMAVLLAVSLGGTWGWASAATIGTLAGGLVLLIAWYIRTARVDDPIVDLRILRQPALRLTLTYAAVAIGIVSFFFLIIPTVVMRPADGWGLGMTEGGLSLYVGLFSLGTFAAGFFVGKAMERVPVPVVGAAVVGVEAAGFLIAAMGLGNAILFGVGTFLVGTAGGAGLAVTYTMIMHVVRPEQQATTSALASLVGNLWAAAMPVVLFALMRAVSPAPVAGVAAFTQSALLIATIGPAAFLLLLGIPSALRLRRLITHTQIDVEPEAGATAPA